jgi:hypothetical protein
MENNETRLTTDLTPTKMSYPSRLDEITHRLTLLRVIGGNDMAVDIEVV